MENDSITISKSELFDLIRKAIRTELSEIEKISYNEQKEIETLHGKEVLYEKDYDKNDYIRL